MLILSNFVVKKKFKKWTFHLNENIKLHVWFQVKTAKLDAFTAISSQPLEKYAFKIEHYVGLTDILERFQKKIFKMEGKVSFWIHVTCEYVSTKVIKLTSFNNSGSSVARAGDMTNELSQSGCSVVYYNVSKVQKTVWHILMKQEFSEQKMWIFMCPFAIYNGETFGLILVTIFSGLYVAPQYKWHQQNKKA